jgi:predicted kinase
MTKLFVMRGLSGSGKSTRAREIADENDAVVVCRDDLRKQLLGSYWTGKKVDEDRVTIAEQASVFAFLKAGVSVVVDATHLHAPYVRKWAKEATRLAVEFEVVDVIEDPAVCRQRDHQRMLDGGRYVGDKVIEQQAKRAKRPVITAEPFIIEPVPYMDDLPDCVIVDIDGTVANHDGVRSHFDYSKVLQDSVHENIAWLVRTIFHTVTPRADGEAPVDIIFMSGRDDTCRVDTERWLDMHNIPYDRLIMRPADAKDASGNKLPDYQVKYHLFNEYIRGKYNVRVVIDDRDQVVDMWRQLGLNCAQVAEGDF